MDRRSLPRDILHTPAKIVVEGVAQDCVIHDQSKVGARLTNFGALKLPESFMLQVGKDNAVAVRAWLIWQDETQAGVTFIKPKS